MRLWVLLQGFGTDFRRIGLMQLQHADCISFLVFPAVMSRALGEYLDHGKTLMKNSFFKEFGTFLDMKGRGTGNESCTRRFGQLNHIKIAVNGQIGCGGSLYSRPRQAVKTGRRSCRRSGYSLRLRSCQYCDGPHG